MKRYSTTVVMHIVAIAASSVGCFYAFISGMPFTSVLLLIFLTVAGYNLYRLQMIQIRLMQQLARNIRCGETALSFRPEYRNHNMEEMTDELREAMRLYRLRTLEANELESWQKLIRVMGHEIMNSITPIISLSETLSTRELHHQHICSGNISCPTPDKTSGTENSSTTDEYIRNYNLMQQGMQVIHKRSKGLLEFVENYRRLTKIPLPIKEKIELGEMLEGIKPLFPDNFIHIYTPQEKVIIRADRTQIEQVLINLIKNAIDACRGEKSPCVEVKCNSGAVSSPDGSTEVSVTVTDNGEGIPPEVMEHIFIPFFSTKKEGNGIGLSLCRQIMHRHGGSITAASTPGEGSCFTIHFQ